VLSEKDKSVTLEPKNWLGKKFPLFEFIVFDNGFNRDNLKIGGWSILLYHVDCKKCQELLAKINDQSKNETFENLILIEIPGKEVKQGFFNGVQSHVVSGTLQSGTEWFVQTPVLLKLSHGMVLDISTNDNIQFPAK
jgi:hypothetical protein